MADMLGRLVLYFMYMKESGEWSGTASQLLEDLTLAAKGITIGSVMEELPIMPHILTRKLNRMASDLEGNGVKIEYCLKRVGGKPQRTIRITAGGTAPLQAGQWNVPSGPETAGETESRENEGRHTIDLNLMRESIKNAGMGRGDADLITKCAIEDYFGRVKIKPKRGETDPGTPFYKAILKMVIDNHIKGRWRI